MNRSTVVKRVLKLAALAACGVTRVGAAAPSREYDLGWTITVEGVPAGAQEARAWIAIPQELPEQRVSGLEVDTGLRWTIVQDATFHNKVVLVDVPRPPSPIRVKLRAHVVRDAIEGPRRAKLDAKERALYLRKEALVSLSPRIRALADSVGGDSRARYDFVLAKMDYDKTVPGWGRGDSERACDVNKGNCTDFHSLFMSLSRAEGVPAVFEMGYSTLPGGETNQAGGYHCWAWFYDDRAKGWVPVDISEADKHPEKASYFYGHLDADRITFSRGRDVVLPGMKGAPLNYLPTGAYVEVDGKLLETGITRTISYGADPQR
ncbi:MAG: transglutaminase domain-containing protein [Candidatus Eisenbacteria bacterium]|uniref:Transglutaminase domain-containing protein n=1 Tax=Eiseniibacteriota bacterium TaxID=2212470 RepID=A0A538SKB1_UNCEI|nr:MAG: transglutaminase domain-containing protein [Candidatus Eisenbacteria bacterium]